MADSPTTEQEYELVYQGICAVAANCDGAIEQDGVGFNGPDTKFGRRIAAVPFSEWTEAVRAEAARIALTYQKQILAYTGLDVTGLGVVKHPRELRYQARDDARSYERRARHADKAALRQVDALGGELALSFDRKDPDFDTLKDLCRNLLTRRFDWDAKAWVTPVSEEVEDIVMSWDFNLTDAAQALLQAPRDQVLVTHIDLANNGEMVVIDTPYSPALVEAIKALPGRSYKGGSINHAAVHADVIKLADAYKLNMSPDARLACENAEAVILSKRANELAHEELRTLMAHVSRQADPTSLPPAFLQMLEAILPTDIAERVIVK